MVTLQITINESTDSDEFIKASNFVSPLIENIRVDNVNREIVFELSSTASDSECSQISDELSKLVRKFTKGNSVMQNEVLFKNDNLISTYFNVYRKSENLFFF